MPTLSWSGGAKIAQLLDSGLNIDYIVDSYGRPIHQEAHEFCSYHTQAKRLIIQAAVKYPVVRLQLRENDPTFESSVQLNPVWERKPREDPPHFKEHRMEDLFRCHTCNKWFPWFIFSKGKTVLFGESTSTESIDRTYQLMNDENERGGKRWACNYCIDGALHHHILHLPYPSS